VVEALTLWKPVGIGRGIIQRGWHWMDRAHLSCWDALIGAAAETAGADYLLSEDFQGGRTFGRVTIVNPFEIEPAALGFSPPA
jgi:predicted nucleic acid-binding protein